MVININRREDLEYILEVLEEKGYEWADGTPPTRYVPGMCGDLFHLTIYKYSKHLRYGHGKGNTGFNEAFDYI